LARLYAARFRHWLTSLLHAPASAQALDQRNIIIFVWDGLRPDSVTAKDTVAIGPDFREGLTDELPTGNVDVAPTVASILGLSLPRADGRPLLEALRNGPSVRDFQVVSGAFRPKRPVTSIAVKRPTDPAGNDIEPGQTMYSFQFDTKALSYKGKTYMCFDKAKVIRQ
jgi:hypothetical protein